MKASLNIVLALAGAVLLASCSTRDPLANPDVPAQPVDSFISPNVRFDVITEAGTCPATVGLWEFGLGFEGGADHTVVADFAPMAEAPAAIAQSEERHVVYAAPLKDEFADCTGTATSPYLSMYTFRFVDGTVQFELDLQDDDGFREIRYADLSAQRPYIHWQAAE